MTPPPTTLEILGCFALTLAAMAGYFFLREFGRGWQSGWAIRPYGRRDGRRDSE